jgi:hypothetical protein|uniref:Uncharacterized protein n=2 Tax=Picea TaxID=3328 RepID=A0A117NG31_PICGL|nr:hypothetical protein ABT39_MTgene1919 [Picea glauca]QHR89905.1 hypothetical protein Q903MT_gene3927 [Picea sitchensis]
MAARSFYGTNCTYMRMYGCDEHPLELPFPLRVSLLFGEMPSFHTAHVPMNGGSSAHPLPAGPFSSPSFRFLPVSFQSFNLQ